MCSYAVRDQQQRYGAQVNKDTKRGRGAGGGGGQKKGTADLGIERKGAHHGHARKGVARRTARSVRE